ncbi:MAG TPA: hypothetical protein VG672_28065 [Bryobacteraceae bacterium]|nr:hypothetical protein [Bryobacteraceae bacterium]
MWKVAAAICLLALTALAANLKLYLKDGTYQLVREYQVKADRVSFYSVERSQWEEVPVSLVDLKRTESEIAERKAALAEEAKTLSEEDKAVREMEEEAARIPQNPGVYYVEGKEAKALKLAESSVHGNKRRSVLKVMTPIPVVSGKATVELQGERAATVLDKADPEFYIRLSDEERFGLFKLTPQKGVRVVEKVTIVPVTKEVIEEPEEVEIFRKQIGGQELYKIWPQKPLEPGEYAVVQYTAGKLNPQIWDFACRPAK